MPLQVTFGAVIVDDVHSFMHWGTVKLTKIRKLRTFSLASSFRASDSQTSFPTANFCWLQLCEASIKPIILGIVGSGIEQAFGVFLSDLVQIDHKKVMAIYKKWPELIALSPDFWVARITTTGGKYYYLVIGLETVVAGCMADDRWGDDAKPALCSGFDLIHSGSNFFLSNTNITTSFAITIIKCIDRFKPFVSSSSPCPGD